jgi:hypothetical protein
LSVIELFGVAALVALGTVAVVFVAMLVRDPHSGEGPTYDAADDETVEADLAAHGVQPT